MIGKLSVRSLSFLVNVSGPTYMARLPYPFMVPSRGCGHVGRKKHHSDGDGGGPSCNHNKGGGDSGVGKKMISIGDDGMTKKTIRNHDTADPRTAATTTAAATAVATEKWTGRAGAKTTVRNRRRRSSSPCRFLCCYRSCCGRRGCHCYCVGDLVVAHGLVGGATVADTPLMFTAVHTTTDLC